MASSRPASNSRQRALSETTVYSGDLESVRHFFNWGSYEPLVTPEIFSDWVGWNGSGRYYESIRRGWRKWGGFAGRRARQTLRTRRSGQAASDDFQRERRARAAEGDGYSESWG